MKSDLYLWQKEMGAVLRGARESLGLSLRTLARDTGVSPSQILRIESGEFDCLVSSLVKLCSALAVKPGELLELCLWCDRELYDDATHKEENPVLPAGFIPSPISENVRKQLVRGACVVLAHLLRSSMPARLSAEFSYPTNSIRDRFLKIGESLNATDPPLDTRFEFLDRLQKAPSTTLQKFYRFPTAEHVAECVATPRSGCGSPNFLWLPMRPRLEYNPEDFVPRLTDEELSAAESLTKVTQESNSACVQSKLEPLIERVTRACEGEGQRTALARWLDVPLPRISEWLSGKKRPNGETTLRLLEWVTTEEATQQKSPANVRPSAEPKTQPRTESQNENQTKSGRKKR